LNFSIDNIPKGIKNNMEQILKELQKRVENLENELKRLKKNGVSNLNFPDTEITWKEYLDKIIVYETNIHTLYEKGYIEAVMECLNNTNKIVNMPICLHKNRLYVYKTVEPEKTDWDLFDEKDQENFVFLISQKFFRARILLGHDETVSEEVNDSRYLCIVKMRVELWEKQTNRIKLVKNIRELVKK